MAEDAPIPAILDYGRTPELTRPGDSWPGLRAQACCEIDGQPYMLYGGVLAPAVAPHLIRAPDPAKIREAVHRQGAHGALWSYDWDCGPSPWYFVACDNPKYSVESFPHQTTRNRTRSGLKRTEVRRVAADWLASNGYSVFAANFALYGAVPESAEQYRASMAASESTTEWWGAFCGTDLAAYTGVFFDSGASFISVDKFHPEFRSNYAMNALRFKVAHHYVVERGFRYLSGGPRALAHETSVAEVRVKMGWRLIYAKLGVYWTPKVSMARRALLLGARVPGASRLPIGGMLQKARTVDLSMRIAEACRRNECPPELDDEALTYIKSIKRD